MDIMAKLDDSIPILVLDMGRYVRGGGDMQTVYISLDLQHVTAVKPITTFWPPSLWKTKVSLPE